MKILFDFLPIILFFVAYKLGTIYTAAGVAIITSVLLLVWIYLKGNKPDMMQWISLAIVTIFGGAGIILQNELYILWKPTALYLLMGLSLGGAQVFFKRNLLRILMDKQTTSPSQSPIVLPDFVWTRLLWMWVGFFLSMAILNLIIAYLVVIAYVSMDIWVDFKTFGGVGLMIVFIIFQSIYMARHIKEEKDDTDSKTQAGL